MPNSHKVSFMWQNEWILATGITKLISVPCVLFRSNIVDHVTIIKIPIKKELTSSELDCIYRLIIYNIL